MCYHRHMKRSLPLLLVLLPLFGCSTTTIGYDGVCPARPVLYGLSPQLQKGSTRSIRLLADEDTDPELAAAIDAVAEQEAELQRITLDIMAGNQLTLKQHIVDLEDLSGCNKDN